MPECLSRFLMIPLLAFVLLTVPGESRESFDEESPAAVAVSRVVLIRRQSRRTKADVRLQSDECPERTRRSGHADNPILIPIAPHGRPDNTRGDPAPC